MIKWILVYIALTSPASWNSMTLNEAFDSLEECEGSGMFQYYTPPRDGIGTICLPWPPPQEVES